MLVLEYLLDGQPEEPGSLERQRQAGIELALLDRIDGLSRDFQFLCKPGLCPLALCAQYFQPVLHW